MFASFTVIKLSRDRVNLHCIQPCKFDGVFSDRDEETAYSQHARFSCEKSYTCTSAHINVLFKYYRLQYFVLNNAQFILLHIPFLIELAALGLETALVVNLAAIAGSCL